MTLLAGGEPFVGQDRVGINEFVLSEEEDVGTQALPCLASSILVTRSWAALLPLWSPRHKVKGTSEHGQKAQKE